MARTSDLSFRGATWESREGSCEFAGGFPIFRACTARLPRLLRSLAMTNLIACFTRRGAMTSLRAPSSRVIARRAKPDVAISSRHYRIRRGFPVFRACTARLPRLLRSLAMTNPRADAVGGQPRRIHMPFPGIATFPNQQTNPPIWDSSSLSAHLSFCGTSSLSASHARLLLSHPVLFQNKLIYEHDIAL